MVWTIEYTSQAKRHLARLDLPVARRIDDFLRERVCVLAAPWTLAEPLVGPHFGGLWRFRVGDYRVICEFENNVLNVLVLQIGHRREIYRP